MIHHNINICHIISNSVFFFFLWIYKNSECMVSIILQTFIKHVHQAMIIKSSMQYHDARICILYLKKQKEKYLYFQENFGLQSIANLFVISWCKSI